MTSGLNATPMANRLAISIFGRRNAGKSSLINAITGQQVAVTSDVAGTTTDPVYKTMELLPLGPVVFIDTAGLDDVGELGRMRIEKTYEVLRKTNLAILALDAKLGISDFETEFVKELKQRDIPLILAFNKADKARITKIDAAKMAAGMEVPAVIVSATSGYGIEELKSLIIKHARIEENGQGLISGLIKPGDIAVLVTPIDKSAPKGRLILPQQQTIREIIEAGAVAVISKEHELKMTLESLNKKPSIVITDSQAFAQVSADTPSDIPLTSFSILFARQKGELAEMVRGLKSIAGLKAGDRVLIVEGCTHHRQGDDIGTVKIPRWIKQISGQNIQFEWASGACYPKDIAGYAAIVHCGGCMLNNKEMAYRIARAKESGVGITNYGMLIAYVLGILKRALKPFPAAYRVLEDEDMV
ncbi:MAG: [FeFe] hydrogenase H-cluster maturation GTPase HydF [Christensenellales bacterium]|jgi:[FeFe] hydrogenase H-cluster maturation GTPase HydF